MSISNNENSENSSVNESDNLSWLVYKGNKIPFHNNKYRIREGDIIKLGREWLLIKDIHISGNAKKQLKNNKENTKENPGIFLSYHSQSNQSLNINEDFQDFENNATEEEKDSDDEKKINATDNVNTKRLFKKGKNEK